MSRTARWILALSMVLGAAVAAPSARAQDYQANIARAQKTLDQMASLLDSIDRRHAEGGGSAAVEAAGGGGRTYTVVMRGAMCNGCAGVLAKAVGGVNGCSVVTAPKKGNGNMGVTTCVVTLNSEDELGALKSAVADAKTPHAAQSKPQVMMVVAGKLKPDANPRQVMQALRAAQVGPGASPTAIADALRKANLLEE